TQRIQQMLNICSKALRNSRIRNVETISISLTNGTVRIEETLHQIPPLFDRSCQILLRNALLSGLHTDSLRPISIDILELHPFATLATVGFAGIEAPAISTSPLSIIRSPDPFGNLSRRELIIRRHQHPSRTGHQTVADQRPDHIGIHRKLSLGPLHCLIHRNEVLHSLMTVIQLRQQTLGQQRLRTVDRRTLGSTLMIRIDSPQMIVRDIKSSTVAQSDTVDLTLTLREDTEHLLRSPATSESEVTRDEVSSTF